MSSNSPKIVLNSLIGSTAEIFLPLSSVMYCGCMVILNENITSKFIIHQSHSIFKLKSPVYGDKNFECRITNTEVQMLKLKNSMQRNISPSLPCPPQTGGKSLYITGVTNRDIRVEYWILAKLGWLNCKQSRKINVVFANGGTNVAPIQMFLNDLWISAVNLRRFASHSTQLKWLHIHPIKLGGYTDKSALS